MNIGCNWSEALKFLLEREAVKIDYIKSGTYGSFNEEFSTMRSKKDSLQIPIRLWKKKIIDC